MRRANESERYGSGGERERGGREGQRAERIFSLLGQATGAYNMHPAAPSRNPLVQVAEK